MVDWQDDPLIGSVLGDRYQIVEPLGRGGMGDVYLAETLPDELEVAVKIIRPEHMAKPRVHERFLREVEHTGAIDSPHVVRILDSGMSLDGRAFMVMERLVGESLTERLSRMPALTTVEALRIARDVCRALAAAHKAGVIHRDLKPDNVYLCEDGTVKVLDLGIAKAFSDERRAHEPSLTEAHRVVGTPAYMSPEIITKDGLSPASDLYSLGVMIYELTVGVPPFMDDDPVGTMYMHIRDQPRRLREVVAGLQIPGGLETLVADLLTKDPSQRPKDAEAVVRRLNGLIRIVRERATHSETGELTKVWAPGADRERRRRRLPTLIVAAALALFLGFGATVVVIYFLSGSQEAPQQLPDDPGSGPIRQGPAVQVP